MQTRWITGAAIVVAVAALVVSALGGARTDDALGVAVSPQKLLLGTTQSGTVVVHTYIPYGDVDRTTLALNGVAATGTGVDSLGHIVVIFDEQEIKAIVCAPECELTLTGLYVGGEPFSGTDRVKVEEYPAP